MSAPLRYRCDLCGEEHESDWTEEEAREEAVDKFGAVPADSAIVCDDCYRAMGFTTEPRGTA